MRRTKQLTLVALYGEKPTVLVEVIFGIQNICKRELGTRFIPYDMEQIHATLVSLERKDNNNLINLNFARYRHQIRPMDFQGLLNYIRFEAPFPFHVQIGGFTNKEYSFKSRDAHPYNRSFSLAGDKVVIIGWPVNSTRNAPRYSNELQRIRKDVEGFGFLHSYHNNASDRDNDFYFRIGVLDEREIDAVIRIHLEDLVRQHLSNWPPATIRIGVPQLFLAAYIDETLPLQSTRVIPINDDSITQESIQHLYDYNDLVSF